jgi:hypothetical protein
MNDKKYVIILAMLLISVCIAPFFLLDLPEQHMVPVECLIALGFVAAALLLWLLYRYHGRNVDRWITPIPYSKAVGSAAEIMEKDPAVIYWLSDYFLMLHANGTKTEYSHQIIHLKNTLRVSDFEQTGIVHPLGACAVRQIRAAHYSKDGVLKKVKITRMPSFPAETQNGMEVFAGHNVQFLNLVANDTTEFSFVRDFVKPPVQGKFNWDAIFVNFHFPYCVRRRITVAVHRDSRSEIKQHHLELEPRRWSKDGYEFYEWDLQHLPAYKDEYAQPPARDCQPWFDISTCPGWDPIIVWLRKHLIKPVKDKKEVKDILGKIVTPEMKLRDKAKACYDYCVNQISYGRESSLKPADNAQAGDQVAKVLRGDCKDQTSLLLALFQELGIASEAAAVRVEDGAKTPYLPSQRFDHAILRCQIDGEYLWVDPTAKHIVFGNISQELEGSEALLIYPDKPGEWVDIPYSSKAKNTTTYRAQAQFVGDDLKISLDMIYHGHFAAVVRGYMLYTPESMQESLATVFNERIGACNLDQFSLQDGWQNQDPFHLKVTLTARNWLKHAGDLHLLKLPWLGCHIGVATVAEQSRKTDYMVPGPERVEYHLEMVLPDGHVLDKKEATQAFTAYGHSLTVSYVAQENKLLMSTVLETEVAQIPRQEYGGYRDFVQTVNKFFENLLVLKPKGQ